MINIFYLILFLGEVALWVGVGRLAYLTLDSSRGLSIFAAVVATIIILVLWGFFFSPKVDFRIDKLPRTIAIVIMSVAVGAGLYIKGDRNFGLLVLKGTTFVQIIGQYFLSDN